MINYVTDNICHICVVLIILIFVSILINDLLDWKLRKQKKEIERLRLTNKRLSKLIKRRKDMINNIETKKEFDLEMKELDKKIKNIINEEK